MLTNSLRRATGVKAEPLFIATWSRVRSTGGSATSSFGNTEISKKARQKFGYDKKFSCDRRFMGVERFTLSAQSALLACRWIITCNLQALRGRSRELAVSLQSG